ncbi:MAG: hypothetical protein ACE15B_03635 [Bryobacteraceae bacterium]
MKYVALAVLAATSLLADVNSTVYVPHIVDGGSWQTTFVIVNLATLAPGQAIIHLWARDGSALPVSFSGVSGGSPVSQVTVNLPPGGVATLETLGNAANTTIGWADMDVQTSGHMAISAVMRQRVAGRPDYEVVVPSMRTATTSKVFVFDHISSAATGFGMANASRLNAAAVDVTIRDETGRSIQTAVLNLPAGAQTSFSLADQFPVTAGKRGTIEFAPQPGGWFNIIGLRFNPTGPFTSVEGLAP